MSPKPSASDSRVIGQLFFLEQRVCRIPSVRRRIHSVQTVISHGNLQVFPGYPRFIDRIPSVAEYPRGYSASAAVYSRGYSAKLTWPYTLTFGRIPSLLAGYPHFPARYPHLATKKDELTFLHREKTGKRTICQRESQNNEAKTIHVAARRIHSIVAGYTRLHAVYPRFAETFARNCKMIVQTLQNMTKIGRRRGLQLRGYITAASKSVIPMAKIVQPNENAFLRCRIHSNSAGYPRIPPDTLSSRQVSPDTL